ncbi:hypothetical protein GON01_15250 [Sphingomonas sp. MAH-20]|uniref:Poly(3-hydroxyalkanoate) polymerase subunit PhaE n=1 Tax=Sphingomonas horti TaxID=2682842 RepID=A0A6I4J5A1_9SPHN|nr:MULTISPECIES: hypothetical protein [Sphingomonas]MBA2919255.1 hypothetical protein [Sphingomonas sp. CGMCC 1.13658]MVO79288.1 hypothetical protein [Sphingomonas horti]
MSKPDPGAFFREMLGQWEGIASQFSAEMMKSGDLAKTMQGATSAGLKAKEAAKEAMSRALEAANMPSREDMIDMTARMRGVEARLDRIEALLAQIADRQAAPAAKPSKKSPKKGG